jgi:hypothetical protein
VIFERVGKENDREMIGTLLGKVVVQCWKMTVPTLIYFILFVYNNV